MLCRSSVKRGRKALAVSEGYIDVTGKTHIMTVRRSVPLTPKKKTVKNYIDVLSERLDKLENLTQRIVDVTKLNNDQIVPPEATNFSAMGIDDLIEFSNHLN
ncbi:22287_t:CDS:2, partial [Racocetra persica]